MLNLTRETPNIFVFVCFLQISSLFDKLSPLLNHFVLLPVHVDVLDQVRLPDMALVSQTDLHQVDHGERVLLGVAVRPVLDQGDQVVQHLNISNDPTHIRYLFTLVCPVVENCVVSWGG